MKHGINLFYKIGAQPRTLRQSTNGCSKGENEETPLVLSTLPFLTAQTKEIPQPSPSLFTKNSGQRKAKPISFISLFSPNRAAHPQPLCPFSLYSRETCRFQERPAGLLPLAIGWSSQLVCSCMSDVCCPGKSRMRPFSTSARRRRKLAWGAGIRMGNQCLRGDTEQAGGVLAGTSWKSLDAYPCMVQMDETNRSHAMEGTA